MNTYQELGLENMLVDSAYLLTHLELYNWGPFCGLHRAEIDANGTAIIGQTGSGKTTLVDAFMTLIAQNPKYNLASTGGHESDRDLISYIRGVTGAGNESGDNDHILRPGKTVTGISAYFNNGENTVQIIGVLWIDGSSSATADLKRIWIFSLSTQHGLIDLLESLQEGGMRALKQLGRDADNIKVYDSKKAYLAQLRRYFEVSDNAFTLLNRAAGLKQLNSIDELFRELVLDDRSSFKRAAEVAAEFDDLASIHAELETARKQQQSLMPIAAEYQRYIKNSGSLDEKQTLRFILPKWFASHAYRLWQIRENTTAQEVEQCQQIAITLDKKIGLAQKQSEQCHEIYLKLGGTSIEQLQEQIKQQQAIVNTCQVYLADYRQLTARLKMEDQLDAVSLARNQQQAEQLKGGQQKEFNEKQQLAWEKGASFQQQRGVVKELEEEIRKVNASPDSNIPGNFSLFRAELAQTLDLEEQQLPFIAELVEVKTDQAHWRGAIERAIGSHRLRLLVPAESLKAALQWVNNRDNRLHVRLLEAKVAERPPSFWENGFTRKLNFKPHIHREALKNLLAGIDRHCVDDSQSLKHTAHAMTQQGLMSGKQGVFEKQDHRRLDQDWMTGFDNKDRLNSLGKNLIEIQSELTQSEKAFEQAKHDCAQIEQNIKLLEQLCTLEFADIDVSTAETQLKMFHEKLQSLLDPDSDTEKARERWEKAKEQLKDSENCAKENEKKMDRFQYQCDQARQEKENAFQRMRDGLDDEQKVIADKNFELPSEQDIHNLADIERVATEKLQDKINKLKDKVSDNEIKLGKLMIKAKAIDSGALSEADTEVIDVPVYLAQLKVLDEEALPEKQNRFLMYLNQSSDQGVTQLLSNIGNEVNKIEERIEELNQTMRRVDFQPGNYLRLEPRRVVHESLKTLQKAQRYLRTAALKEDNGESHYRALFDVVALLRDAVDRKKTLGAKALLDPRYRLQFFVSIVNKNDGEVIETRTGSQGGSGGEKEIIASYILTASLSYALCPSGFSRPLFSTIILDEAFSKSSRAVAARIISALREFGLHPLFITPNKEIRLLRDHTRSAVLIHRREQSASMTSLSWQELEVQAKTQLEKMTYEVTD